jgi:hypothetical protein
VTEQYRQIMRTQGKEPKRILLVGGLGSSRYLFKQLQRQFNNVVQPQRAWSAVARGAVIKLLRHTFSQNDFITAKDPRLGQLLLSLPEVETRIARMSYGVESGIETLRALPQLDRKLDRVSVDPDGNEVVWRMKWYLKQVSVQYRGVAGCPATDRSDTDRARRSATETPCRSRFTSSSTALRPERRRSES